MKNFKHIEKYDVWTHLQDGKNVYVAIFKSRNFVEGIYNLRKNCTVNEISRLVSDKENNVIFYEEVEN